ncbi:MAG: endo-1,4-beta-xylanase [Beijerinckiaceae bacterium]
MQPTRRSFLAGAGAAIGAGAWSGAGLAQMAGTEPSLGALAARRGLLFGASATTGGLADAGYRALYQREARIITADYEMKFDVLRGSGPQVDFRAADALADFAKANSMGLRGHALIWNENLPRWLKVASRREIEAAFFSHIEETATRYAGRMHSWDVVNEAIWPDHGAARGLRRGAWHEALGPSYVRHAFQRAAQCDKSAKLVLNEAFCERNDGLGQAVRRHLLALIDELQDNDTPLHAVGLQAHLQPQFAHDDEVYVDFLRALAKRKLDIYITELDVDDSSYGDDVAQRDAKVAARYREFLTKVLTVPQVKVIVLWQLADRFSWYADPEIAKALKITRPMRPLPYDAALKRKPAWDAIADALKTRAAV